MHIPLHAHEVSSALQLARYAHTAVRILLGSILGPGLALITGCGGGTEPPPPPGSPIPERTYGVDLSHVDNSCGATISGGTLSFYVQVGHEGDDYWVLGIVDEPTPATLSGDRLTLRAVTPVSGGTITLDANWIFAEARHTFQGTTTYDWAGNDGTTCVFTFASTGTHDLAFDTPSPQTPGTPDTTALDGAGHTTVVAADLSVDVPAHGHFRPRCIPLGDGTGSLAIQVTPEIDVWPEATQEVIGGDAGNLQGLINILTGGAGKQTVYFGLWVVQENSIGGWTWYLGNNSRGDMGWISGAYGLPLKWYGVQFWRNGRWEVITYNGGGRSGSAETVQAITVVPAVGSYWIGPTYVWGPLPAGGPAVGSLHPQVSSGPEWEQIQCPSE